jgi:hypothetical protein
LFLNPCKQKKTTKKTQTIEQNKRNKPVNKNKETKQNEKINGKGYYTIVTTNVNI